MKCQICGREAEVVQKFDCDGVEKMVAFCKRCFSRVLREAPSVYKAGLVLMAKHAEIVQDSLLSYSPELYGSHVNVFVAMPVAVQTMLFLKDEDSEDRATKELYKRELVVLKERLRRAVEREDYKAASLIKRRIQRLEEILKK